jgi:hypothetical protein
MRREKLKVREFNALVEATHRSILEERLAEYDPATEDFRTLDEVRDQLLGIRDRAQDFL